jgi:MFS family permease
MSPAERRAMLGLASIFGLRMLGMFIILPVFALHAQTIPGGADRTLVGLALGAYGLTQAVLQVPFGWASDRWGRKPAIAIGLLVFALGSFVAAWAPDIFWTIAGRTLQGAGAISAAVIALTADLTRDEVRTRAMAAIGMTIGGTFALSLVAGPLLESRIGVSGIFAATGFLALAAIGVLKLWVPSAETSSTRGQAGLAEFRNVLADPQLLRLNIGIFVLHGVLMALFVQVPFALRDAGLAPARHWQVYLPVVLASVALLYPALRIADRPGQAKTIFLGAVVVLALSQLMLAFAEHSLPALVVSLMVFFAAFNLLEALLPSLVSKFAPPRLKGTAIGVYSSTQFLGAFAGAAIGGALAQHFGAGALFAFGVALTLLWLLAGATMAPPPAYRSNYSMGET